jgi:site-specific recombinase XerD
VQVERLKLLLSGPQAEKLREEFEDTIASELRNPNTLSAYLYAWRNFVDWCGRQEQKLDPLKVRAAHVGAWIAQHKGKPRTQRQHLSAVRRLFDVYVLKGLIETNPAARVKAAKFSVRRAGTTSLDPDEARRFFAQLKSYSLLQQRNMALVRVFFHHAPRVSAVVKLRVADYFLKGKQRWLRLGEKHGKVHELPVHPKAQQAIEVWLANSGLSDQSDWPLFPAFLRDRETSICHPISRRSLYKLLRRFARKAEIDKKIGCHSFRATAITFFRENGGSLEDAAKIANHERVDTTKLYDHTSDKALAGHILRVDIPEQ